MCKKNETKCELYRVVTEGELIPTIKEKKLQHPGIYNEENTNSEKWLTEDPNRDFANKKVKSGDKEFLVAYVLTRSYFDNIKETAIKQRKSKKQKNSIKFNKENLKGTGLFNYAIPESEIKNFNNNLIRVYIYKQLGERL